MNKIIKIFILTIVVGTVTLYFLQTNGNHSGLKWYNLESGLSEGKKQNKMILMDVYTDWCKWCKKMDSDVYSNKEIISYLQENFICVKLDGEGNALMDYNHKEMTETDITKQLGIDSYPTTVFYKSNGDLISSIPGYYPVNEFMNILVNINKNRGY
jgi:thioredoxin-related protein